MDQHYILVEGINIYANVFDTNQLSVIRGSSFSLKYAINHIKNKFSDQLTAISTGASSGLFLVKEGSSPLVLSNNIVDELNQPDKNFNLFTFVVEHCSANNLLEAKEQLVAQLRIRQMQSLTLAPDVSSKTIDTLNYPDQLEGRRIAKVHRELRIQKKTCHLSHSVFSRWEYGKGLKRSCYLQENKLQNSNGLDTLNEYNFQENKLQNSNDLDTLNEYNFCAHFEDLADNNGYSKLNGKMAVIYMDGNSFSKKQQTILEKAQARVLNLS